MCDEERRNKVKQLLTERTFPDPDTIVSPAYLVIGATPDEDRKGRDFYDNPAYYTLDNAPVSVDGPRHIIADFNEVPLIMQLSFLYCEKFDGIIFDYSTYKFFRGNNLEYLLKMVKPNGFFITELATLGVVDSKRETDGLNSAGIAKVFKRLRKEKELSELEDIKKTGFSARLISFNTAMSENPLARSIYRPVIKDIYGPCIILQKKPEKRSIFSMFGRSGGKRKRKTRRRAMKPKQ